MKYVCIGFLTVPLVGCSADTMSAATTAAGVKQREMEQGKRTLSQYRKKIEAAEHEMQRSAEKTAAAADSD
jgi:hypothetical protein